MDFTFHSLILLLQHEKTLARRNWRIVRVYLLCPEAMLLCNTIITGAEKENAVARSMLMELTELLDDVPILCARVPCVGSVHEADGLCKYFTQEQANDKP